MRSPWWGHIMIMTPAHLHLLIIKRTNWNVLFLLPFFTMQSKSFFFISWEGRGWGCLWFLLKFYPTSCGDSDWTVWPGSLLTIFIFISIISHFSRQTPQSTDLYSNKQLYIGRKTFIKFRFNNKHQVDSGWMCNFQLYLLVVNTL